MASGINSPRSSVSGYTNIGPFIVSVFVPRASDVTTQLVLRLGHIRGEFVLELNENVVDEGINSAPSDEPLALEGDVVFGTKSKVASESAFSEALASKDEEEFADLSLVGGFRKRRKKTLKGSQINHQGLASFRVVRPRREAGFSVLLDSTRFALRVPAKRSQGGGGVPPGSFGGATYLQTRE